MPPSDPVAQLEQLGRAGVLVSIACGPCGYLPFAWSVSAMSRDGREFQQPYRADSFAHAVEIAHTEVTRRGWTDAAF